ncbi:MAG: RsmD family RNA methyltransferase [Bacteroidetes bacterium]|nr:RsmD family RNA methyltransferase [Bacteroidota bacterium]
MTRLPITLLGVVLLMTLNGLTVQAQVAEDDSLALVALYNATDGPNWSDNSNWLTAPVPQWNGVTITGVRVTRLDLRSNRLTGSIPPELGNLANLEILFLNNNDLTGSIPVELGNLTNLSFLLLEANDLTGSIPVELGNLANLTFLPPNAAFHLGFYLFTAFLLVARVQSMRRKKEWERRGVKVDQELGGLSLSDSFTITILVILVAFLLPVAPKWGVANGAYETMRNPLEALEGEREIPTEEDLRAARAYRDEGWKLVRRAVESGENDSEEIRSFIENAPSSTDLWRTYEMSVQQADVIADRLRAEADRITRSAALLAERAKLDEKNRGFNVQLRDVQAKHDQTLGSWRELWKALGIEAMSRGGQSCCFVEKDRAMAAVIRENLAAIGFSDASEVIVAPVERAIGRLSGPYTLVLADPPYADAAATALLGRLAQSGAIDGDYGTIVFEHSTREEAAAAIGAFLLVRSLRHGDSSVSIYRPD